MSANTWIVVILVALFFAVLIWKMVRSFRKKRDTEGDGTYTGGGGAPNRPIQRK